MDGWEEKLNTILNDPDAMAQIMSLAQNLNAGTNAPSGEAAPPAASADGGTSNSVSAGSGSTAPAGGGLDPALLKRLAPVLQQASNGAPDNAAALLYALRPYLREERRGKVERAVQLARMFRLARAFMGSQEG